MEPIPEYAVAPSRIPLCREFRAQALVALHYRPVWQVLATIGGMVASN